MFSSLLKPQAILDEESIIWIFDTYAWALRNFDAEVFYNESILVTPSNEHFPGRENSVHGMASLIFDKVCLYAGVSHWPFYLINEKEYLKVETPKIRIQGALRGVKGIASETIDEDNRLTVTYNAHLLNDPEVMIGHYAHTLAHYLGSMAQEPPPGGVENWPHITELLAVFMGFGIMMANSAYTNKVRSCGSCAGPIVERSNFLSQYDITYALAIYCHLKNIPLKSVKPYLKKSLLPYFKKAQKDAERRIKNDKSLPQLSLAQLELKS